MQIKWVEIKNFRSINNSKRLSLSSDLTVIAGKNESGKSNILQALKCFSENKFSTDDYPIHNEGSEPEVTVCFEMDGKELSQVDKKANLNSNYELIVTRSNEECLLNGEAMDICLSAGNQNIEAALKKIDGQLADILLDDELQLDFNIDIEIDEDVTNLISSINSYLKTLNENTKMEHEVNLNSIFKQVKVVEEEIENREQYYEDFENLIPNFVLFDSFTDILPNSFTNEDEDQQIIKRFFSLTDYDLLNLFAVNGQRRKQLANRVSASISGDFNDYYHQDIVKIKVEPDGEEIYFFIYDKDEENPFRPEQRSKGFQWFLSFFITLSAEKKNSILLIDEPGLYLHPKAQRDILTLLEKLSCDNQVLITTHSPYFIDPDNLERIRLVNKVNGATNIENKFYKGADKDTLTPIITSIGLDITKDMTFSNKGNVVVEGISDYYYLGAMRTLLGSECPIADDINIIPSVGASQSLNMIALLLGWGLEFKVLFDNDNEGKRVAKKAKQNFDLSDETIVMVSNNNDFQIEDLFSNDDFNNFIIDGYREKKDVKNSSKIKSTGTDKVLISKRFKERINSGEKIMFSEETVQNFKALFLKLGNKKLGTELVVNL